MCEANGFVIQRPQDAPYQVWKAVISAFQWRRAATLKKETS